MKLEAFWDNVEQKYNQPDICLEWQGAINSDGYGNLVVDGHYHKAHRMAYLLTKGEIPKGMEVCHSCDNPSCCNPNHLWLGTHKQNTDDMTKKRRFARKLSDGQVEEIRQLKSKGCSDTKLSEMFGVSRAQIWRIANNRCWIGTGG